MIIRRMTLAHLLSLLGLLWLGMAFVLFTGCEGDDDDDSAGDDDTGDDDDDDDSADDDDTSGDDDTMEGPCEYDPDEWRSVADEDAQSDNGGNIVDVKDYQFQYSDGTLWMRTVSWTDYNDHDPAVSLDMYVSDNVTVAYILGWDNVTPGPLVLFSSDDGYAAPLDNPASFHYCGDDPNATVLAIDLADIGLQGSATLWGAVGVDPAGGYPDICPDDGAFVEFGLVYEPDLEISGTDVMDAGNDGAFDPGEAIDIAASMINTGNKNTGANLTATLALGAGSTGSATLTTDTIIYNAGAEVEPAQEAVPDGSFQIEVDGGAAVGDSLVLEMTVTDDDGNSWDFDLTTLYVGAERLVADPDDFDAPFDISDLFYWVEGGQVHALVNSHSAHQADQEVAVMLDTDLDGVADFKLSTLNDNGQQWGGFYNGDGQNWNHVSDLDAFDYNDGANYTHMAMDIADLGSPSFAFAYASAKAGNDTDLAPNDISDTDDWGLMVFANEPYIKRGTTTWTEVTGNGDGFIDPGETWDANVEARNVGLGISANTVGTMTSADADVVVVNSALNWGSVAVGATASSATAAQIAVDAGAPSDGQYTLDVAVTGDGGAWTLRVPLLMGAQATDTTDNAPLISEDWVLIGDTTDFTNDYNNPSACTGWLAQGNDAVYSLYMLAGEEVDIELDYDAYPPDASMYLSDDPDYPDANCLDGIDDETNTYWEEMEFTAPADGLYYLIIDSYLPGGGPYTVNISF